MLKICDQCNAQFQAVPSAKGRFCSRECLYVWRRSKVTMLKDTKKCSICKETKPASSFHRLRNKGRDYLQGRCKSCGIEYVKQWSRTERGSELKRAHGRRMNLRRFGLTEDAYSDLLAAQGGGCAICGNVTTDSGGRKNLSVDHDHVTGEVRGLLCHSCNVAVGLFRDDVQLLEKALRYLSRPQRTLKLVESGG